jgi:hypothetical protein
MRLAQVCKLAGLFAVRFLAKNRQNLFLSF